MIESGERRKLRSFTTARSESWKGSHFLKVVEVLPKYFIFTVKYSVHTVDGAISAVSPPFRSEKGCGLRMKAERETSTGLHGSQMRGCQLLMGDCLSVAPQDMPAGSRCDPIPPLLLG